MRTLALLPGEFELCVVTTPDTEPCSKLSNEAEGCEIRFVGIDATEPVISLLF